MKKTEKWLEQVHKHTNLLVPALIAVMAVLLVLVIGLSVYKRMHDDGSADSAETTATVDDAQIVTEKWQEGIIHYKDKYYKYNGQIDTYLLLGIDKSGPVEKTTDYTNGGQSDGIFLPVVDKSNDQFSLIAVHRNTMTDIDVYDQDNNYVETITAQLCLQHAYGDGEGLSCRRTVQAVQTLFDDIPIKGYVSLNMDALPIINDAVGGVTVDVLDDLSYPDAGVDLVKGQTVTLSGTEAYYYLRGRDTNVFDSASNRLERQKQYAFRFMDKLDSLSDKTSVIKDMYEGIGDYLVTNVSFDNLLTDLSEYRLSSDHIYSVPGEVVQGSEYEEFYVDSEAFYDIIISIFYNEVTLTEGD